MVDKNNRGTLALAVSGGGARGAYQVGFLQWLAEHYPDLEIPILTGVWPGRSTRPTWPITKGRFARRSKA